MKHQDHDTLEHQLKERLSDKSAPVPELVWDNIKEELFPEKKRRPFFWWWFGSLLLIGMSAGSWLFVEKMHGKETTNKQLAQSEHTQHIGKPKNIEASDQGNNQKHEIDVQRSKHAKTTHENNQQTISGKHNTAYSNKNKQPKKTALQGKTTVYKNPKNSAFTLPKKNQGSPEKAESNPSSTKLPDASNSGNSAEKSLEEQLPAENVKSTQNNDSADKTPSAETENTVPEETKARPQLILTSEDVLCTALSFNCWRNTILPPGSSPEPVGPFAIQAYFGKSLFDVALFQPYFTSGQLSNRSFTSSGFEGGFGVSYTFNDRFSGYANFGYNEKHTEFLYDIALTEEEYFHQYLKEQSIAAEDIDNTLTNKCFLARNAGGSYSVTTTQLTLGGSYLWWNWNRFSLATDLNLTMNLSSQLRTADFTVLSVPESRTDRFNQWRIGAGISINYALTDHFSLQLLPVYALQFNSGKSFYGRMGKELVVPVGVRYRF